MVDLSEGPGSRSGLVERLFEVFGKQLEEIETRLAQHVAGEPPVDETKHLGGLAKTLETLIGMERRIGSTGEERSTDVEALRTELAERLRKLKTGGPVRPPEAA
ncbi:MAG: hypothetical protein AAGF45_08435 [Pseudomonadota bacterium]